MSLLCELNEAKKYNDMLIFGYWLLAVGYWLLAVDLWLLAVGYWSFVGTRMTLISKIYAVFFTDSTTERLLRVHRR